MYLEVMPTGSKYWRLKYRYDGKEKRLAFGVYPEVSLSEAREKREQARKLLKQGVDPGLAKRIAGQKRHWRVPIHSRRSSANGTKTISKNGRRITARTSFTG